MAKNAKKDLVEIIKANPGCVAVVDNDTWSLYKSDPDKAPETDYEDWCDANLLCTDSEVKLLGDGGYGSGHCYGGDILQALAKILGITVKSV